MSLASGLSLLRAVISTLRRHRIPHALGGAAALAVYGVSRSTVDLDLLTTDRRVLVADTWTALREENILVDVRTGDQDDPLAGVVRFSQSDARPVDLVVGRLAWQKAAIDRAEHHQMGEMEVAVLSASDLILMKLYAGGPQEPGTYINCWPAIALSSGKSRMDCRFSAMKRARYGRRSKRRFAESNSRRLEIERLKHDRYSVCDAADPCPSRPSALARDDGGLTSARLSFRA